MKPGKNDPCTCGSGKKYKNCCEGKVAPQHPVAPPAEVDALIALYNARRYAELEGRARILVEQFPNFGFGWKLLGGALQMQGKNALLAFQKTAQLMPGEADAHYNLAVAQKSLGLLDDAAASYRRALKIKPDYAEAHSNLGNVLKDLGRLDESVTCYRRALALKPDSADAHNNLGAVLKDLGQLDEAVACYRRAIKIKPDYADAHYNLGNALKDLGQLDEAAASYRRALEVKPDFADAYNNLGTALKDLGQPEAALASYRRLLELKPDFAEAHNNLGVALKDLGQLDAALASYRRAVELKPDYAEAHNNMGNVLKDLGRHEDALASYRKALELKPDYAEAHHDLGVILRGLRQFDAALESCRRAVELKPDFAEAHNNLGVVLRDLRQFDAALDSCNRALQLNPDHAETHINLGVTLRDLGQMDAALASYRKAAEVNPNNIEAHTGLAFALLSIGLFSEGWKEYRWGINTQDRLKYPVRPLSDNPIFNRRPDELLPANLHGMQIAVLKDQGLGDELFFLRFAKELRNRGARVVYVADPRLASFIRRAKWVDYVAEKREPIGESHAVLFVSELPLVLGMATEADIPPPVPLEVLPEKRQEIALRLARQHKTMQPLIGITWRGGKDKQFHNKSLSKEIPLEQLAAALRGKEATFIVVQRNPLPGELAAFEAALGQPVLDFSALNDDLEGMLALMEMLDDYIGVSNTNMHLRSSVGKSARVLVPHQQDFRWMANGDRSPWFPGINIYRRTPDKDWNFALKQLECHILSNQIQ